MSGIQETQNIDVYRVGAAYLLTLALTFLVCPLQVEDLFPSNESANHNISVINDLFLEPCHIENPGHLPPTNFTQRHMPVSVPQPKTDCRNSISESTM